MPRFSLSHIRAAVTRKYGFPVLYILICRASIHSARDTSQEKSRCSPSYATFHAFPFFNPLKYSIFIDVSYFGKAIGKRYLKLPPFEGIRSLLIRKSSVFKPLRFLESQAKQKASNGGKAPSNFDAKLQRFAGVFSRGT